MELGRGLTCSWEDWLTARTGGRQGRQESRSAPGVHGAPLPEAGKLGAEWAALLWQCREGRGSWSRASPPLSPWGRRGEGGTEAGEHGHGRGEAEAQDNVSRHGARH